MAGALEGVPHEPELALAADELGACLVRDVDAEARARLEHRVQTAIGSDLPFASIGSAARRTRRRCAGRAIRRVVDEDPVDGGAALQARSRVDDVARGHALACVGLGVEGDERLAGRDPDPQLEPLLDRELADRERCADGALGIVLVGGRRAEERHDRVADELLDGAAVALELGAHALVVRPQDRLDVLGIERLRARR